MINITWITLVCMLIMTAYFIRCPCKGQSLFDYHKYSFFSFTSEQTEILGKVINSELQGELRWWWGIHLRTNIWPLGHHRHQLNKFCRAALTLGLLGLVMSGYWKRQGHPFTRHLGVPGMGIMQKWGTKVQLWAQIPQYIRYLSDTRQPCQGLYQYELV